VNVLRDVGIFQEGTSSGMKEENVWTTWEMERGKNEDEFWEKVMARLVDESEERGEKRVRREQVLVVGDEVESDYRAPKRSGMNALVLRGEGEEEGVESVRDLRGVVDWVRVWNRSHP
jgi:FMN phosphatase YigB (HAD superfamily)